MNDETEKIVEASKNAKKDLALRNKNLREVFSHIPKSDMIKSQILNIDKNYTPLIINPNWNDFHFRYWDFGDLKEWWLVSISTTTQEIPQSYNFVFKKTGSGEVIPSKKTQANFPNLSANDLLGIVGYRKNWFIIDNDHIELATKKKEEFFRKEEPKTEKGKSAKEDAKKILAEKPKEEITTTMEDEYAKQKAIEDSIVLDVDVISIEETTNQETLSSKDLVDKKVKIMDGTALVKSENSKKDRMLPELILNAENIKNYIYRGKIPITDQEVVMFLALCHKQKLDPFKRDVYLVKYSVDQPAQMIVSKDLFLKRANECKDYIGLEAGIIIETKESMEIVREGSRVKKEETLVGGYAKVEIKNKRHSYAEVSFEEYFKDYNPSWKRIPATMIRKVAIVQALREGFPDEFQGMYDDAEMSQARDDKD